MILIGMGANLLHPVYGEPLNSLKAAIEELKEAGLDVIGQSSWYRTAPVPVSDQPWFVNAVIEVKTDLSAPDLLSRLHAIEREFGRVREIRWEARVLDLDLLVYHDQVTDNQDQAQGSVIPHPFMHQRGFVLVPLQEIRADWRHPVYEKTADQLLQDLGEQQDFEIVPRE